MTVLRLDHLLTAMAWDHENLSRQRIRHTDGDGGPILDDMRFLKQGRASAGVQHEYSGSIGEPATATWS